MMIPYATDALCSPPSRAHLNANLNGSHPDLKSLQSANTNGTRSLDQLSLFHIEPLNLWATDQGLG